MMKPILALVALACTASPVVAQTSKVYTNADLSSKPVTWSRTVTPEELAGLAARQFVAPPETPGASVFIAPWSGDRPGFLPDNNAIVMAGTSSYADDLWRDPVTAYAVQHPIEAVYGVSYRSSVRPFSSRPAAVTVPTVRPPTPPIVTTAAGAGRRAR